MPMTRIIRPYLKFEDIEVDLRSIFESGMFTRGEHVERFAAELAAYVGVEHAFLTTSATTALWTCLKLLDIGPGDEVAVADFSFPATANVVEDLGGRPVFIDVDMATYNMCPKALEQRITDKTKAVIFVDALGNPTGLHGIKDICSRYDLPLVEDAACALGSSEDGRKCGSIADLTCFSFHPRKLLNTGEGGAITTNSNEWAKWLSVKLMHGADGMRGAGLDFVDYGYNFRLPEIQALMGRSQLARLDAIVADRNQMAAIYRDGLSALGFVAQSVGKGVCHNVQSVAFRVPERLDRNRLIDELRRLEIETTLGTYCLSRGTYFQKKYNDIQENAAQLEDTTITLPCFENAPVERVIEAIGTICN